MPMEQFGQHLLPSLLSLSSDPVANVRVLVAKALRQSVMEKGKTCNSSPLIVLLPDVDATKLNCLFCAQRTSRSPVVPTLKSWRRP